MSDFELQDELQALQNGADSYHITNEHDFSSEDPERLLEAAVEAVAESSDVIESTEVFDVYASLLKHSDVVPGSIMSKLLDSISSALQSQVDSTSRDVDNEDQQTYMAHKAPLEMYAFLLQWFVDAAEKVKGSDDREPAPAPKPRRGRGGKAAGSSRAGARTAAKKSDAWTWMDQIPGILNLICKVLRLKIPRIWTTGAARDTFIACITRPAFHVMVNETYMKNQDIRLGVYKVICLAVKHHNQTLAAQANIVQSLFLYEHLSDPMAECLSVLAKEFDHVQLGEEILREIAGTSFTAQESKGPRTFGRFLVRFAELCPRAVLKQMSLLHGLLDSEAYPIRVAFVEVIGHLITELANQDGDATDKAKMQKEITGLFDILLERMLDISSYVRAKVLSVCVKLCDIKAHKFPKQRLAMASAAVGALDDKASSVRKGAVSLLVQLLLTHPYGIMEHGGLLKLEEWEAEYKKVKDELEKLEGKLGKAVEAQDDEEEGDTDKENEDEDEEGEPRKKPKKEKADDSMDVDGEEDEDEDDDDDEADNDSIMDTDTEGTPKKRKPKKAQKLKPRKSQLDMDALSNEQAVLALEGNQLLHLKLKKKYYVEALTFMREIEGSMDTLCNLLGSTNKAEVLEAMDFFRVALEYQFESAEVGIKKMLHLIWSKDHSATSEDGKELKGVRARLLECYRQLYFDPIPDLEPKAQVSRIAKNMIELTYNATLAELTSLEEMMRSLMEDGQIHPDVVSKLWQVYSSDRPLPKPQRRGAIMILGMLALAKRSVVTDRLETLLKVGLGPLGKADLTLARYTCVALQRLNGSAKKVKGSLLDKTLRMNMDNSVFRKLQDAIEVPCRSKEWFGLAEQIVNTVYALGEHPDTWCDSVIKNLTIRAFAKRDRPEAMPTEKEAEAHTDGDEMNEDPAREDDSMDATQPQAGPEPLSTQSSTPSQGSQQGKDVGDTFELSQLLFVVGHVAIKHIVFLELVEREWKRQKDETQAAEKQAAGQTNANPAQKELEELDQVAGNAEDEIGENVAAIRETELLYDPKSLLALYGSMVVHICGSPHKFKNRTLRAAASLCFSKFLCVSSQFCDQHHRLLFKILETSRDADIRSNIVIALGDVAVSFSSIIDENSNELYKGLSDKDLGVKKNTLMVLTHLILNGMIKVKGQLGEMAKCLEDEDQRIADLAKLFFTELSTKDNAIYNNLPDVISHLSTGEHAVDEEMFRNTMKYIFQFIDKEKQAENIVEKLCQRFRLSEDPRQWRDIAFCLSLLPFKSERSVKKLIEGLQFYRDKLHEETVYDRFTEILTKARQNKSANKPDTELNEFEQILEEHKLQGEEEQALQKRVEGKKAAAKKRATRRNTRKKAQPQPESDDE